MSPDNPPKPLRAGPLVTTQEQISALSQRIDDAESMIALVKRALKEQDPTAAEQMLIGIQQKIRILLPILERSELPNDPPALKGVRKRIAFLVTELNTLAGEIAIAFQNKTG